MQRQSTCWELIQGAAEGKPEEREEFARRYGELVGRWLGARWRGTPLAGELDDAVQEVFVECFREGGVLSRAEPGRGAGFRAFLHGVAANVARRFEERAGQRREEEVSTSFWTERVPGGEADILRAFERAWAEAVVREALEVMRSAARLRGPRETRQVEILHLRFGEGLPIREIAKRWEEDAIKVHREYARAKKAFKETLLLVVARYAAGTRKEIEEHCRSLLQALA